IIPANTRSLASMKEASMKRAQTVYLIHFSKAYRHARHYIGFTTDLNKRLVDHLAGMGARLLEVVVQNGIEFRLARVWPGADRNFERRLKNWKGAAKFCPLCGGDDAMRRAVYQREEKHGD